MTRRMRVIMSMVMGRRGGLDAAAWERSILCVSSATKGDVNWSMLRPNRPCSDRTAARYVCAVKALRSCDSVATKTLASQRKPEFGAKENFSQKARYALSPNEYVGLLGLGTLKTAEPRNAEDGSKP